MIYILSGNDTKNKNIYLRKLCKGKEPTFVTDSVITKETFFEYAFSVNLFGEYSIVVLENFLKENSDILSTKDIVVLKDSPTIFVFLEEKILAPVIKKYEKYSVVEDFSSRATKQIPKMNVFDIADSFSRKDKIGAWILYRKAVSYGVQPEEISGIIFWKIKMMVLSGSKLFSLNELKKISSELVSIYHKAHRGECDFTVGLEQFILSSLTK